MGLVSFLRRAFDSRCFHAFVAPFVRTLAYPWLR